MMRPTTGLLGLLGLTATIAAEETSSPLTFTYNTLKNGSVYTTSTTYLGNATSSTVKGTSGLSSHSQHPTAAPYDHGSWPAQWSHTGYHPHGPPRNGPWPTEHSYGHGSPTASSSSTPTSYSLNYSDLAYPVWSNVSSAIADGSPGPGLPNATQLIADAVTLYLGNKNATAANCASCKSIMNSVAERMKVQQETLHDISVPFCTAISAVLPYNICIGLLNVASTDIGGIFPALDMNGTDGQLVCAFMFELCPLPAPPVLDLQTLFKNTTKPAPKTLPRNGRDPLKVLHFSDYHLDLRYVVGAEANCTSPVCCRVYPYSNASVPVEEPASLFGNYLCDTPEALATSVFRAVPKVTGFDVDEFAFGLYTGDLVSHDLWELTKEYVLAEELSSYQQFFNGLGGVPLYPTLGNHDTFPHAFTAFPNQNGVLPYNASYPVQEQYNYEAISSAWSNYGWLSVSEAQQVINTGLGIYRAKTKDGLVIISLNSDVWYYFNFYAYIGGNVADHTGMFSVFIDYLLEAEEADDPVWVIQHVNTGGSTDYEGLPAPTDLWYAIVDRFNNTIRGTFFGHTHEDEFGVVYSNNATIQNANTAAAVSWIMPSVTTYTDLNAGFRYYLVDPDTFEVMDSINYYANVSNTNEWQAEGDVEWQFEYSARDTYNYDGRWPETEPLTPAFWHSVAEDIKNNATTFHTYTDLRTKKFRPYANVTGTQRTRTICGLFSMSVPIYETCLGSMDSTTSFL